MTSSAEAKQIIEKVLLEGSPEEKRLLFEFDFGTPRELILKKFKIFARGLYPRYFTVPLASFHDDMTRKMMGSYYGEANFLNLAFRGSAKTSLTKLFFVFVLLNDQSQHRKYMKVLTRDQKNSRQLVTDVYNLMIEVSDVYGNVFEQTGRVKREETMGSFTTRDGRKLTAGTVGQTQRGHVQDAYRPDWIVFDDCEDRESIRSSVITQGIIAKCGEAIDGLSTDGNVMVLGNYISDQGVMEWFRSKSYIEMITPILVGDVPTWPEQYPVVKIDQLKSDSDDFYGEYLCDPKRSENKFFDVPKIEADLLNCKLPLRVSAGVKYWINYLPHHRYGMGSDHSEGVGLDANTLALFDFTTGELGVTYANNRIGPDLAVHEFVRVGQEFGNCLYAPEINNKCGGTAITTLKSTAYPKESIYRAVDGVKVDEKQSVKLGWETNSRTKYTMFYEFRKDYNDGLIKIYDKDVLAEMKAYSNSDLNDSTVGLITKHFDLLTAVVIAWQMRKKAEVSGGGMKSYKKTYDKYLESLK